MKVNGQLKLQKKKKTTTTTKQSKHQSQAEQVMNRSNAHTKS